MFHDTCLIELRVRKGFRLSSKGDCSTGSGSWVSWTSKVEYAVSADNIGVIECPPPPAQPATVARTSPTGGEPTTHRTQTATSQIILLPVLQTSTLIPSFFLSSCLRQRGKK